jgi:hypothetical protein
MTLPYTHLTLAERSEIYHLRSAQIRQVPPPDPAIDHGITISRKSLAANE